jgi:hypothetical protein
VVDADNPPLARGRRQVRLEAARLGSFRQRLDLAHLEAQIRKFRGDGLAGRKEGRLVEREELALSYTHQATEGVRGHRYEGSDDQHREQAQVKNPVPRNREASAQSVDPAIVDKRAEAPFAQQLGDAFLRQGRS